MSRGDDLSHAPYRNPNGECICWDDAIPGEDFGRDYVLCERCQFRVYE